MTLIRQSTILLRLLGTERKARLLFCFWLTISGCAPIDSQRNSLDGQNTPNHWYCSANTQGEWYCSRERQNRSGDPYKTTEHTQASLNSNGESSKEKEKEKAPVTAFDKSSLTPSQPQASTTENSTDEVEQFLVQLIALKDHDGVQRFKATYPNYRVRVLTSKTSAETIYHIVLGPYNSRVDAENAVLRLDPAPLEQPWIRSLSSLL